MGKQEWHLSAAAAAVEKDEQEAFAGAVAAAAAGGWYCQWQAVLAKENSCPSSP
jgi:hypothetical protein